MNLFEQQLVANMLLKEQFEVQDHSALRAVGRVASAFVATAVIALAAIVVTDRPTAVPSRQANAEQVAPQAPANRMADVSAAHYDSAEASAR